MNKKDLTESLTKTFDLSKNKSGEIVAHILELMTKSLVKNKPVQLIGFGSFSVKKKS